MQEVGEAYPGDCLNVTTEPARKRAKDSGERQEMPLMVSPEVSGPTEPRLT